MSSEITPQQADANKTLTHVLYALYAATLVSGISSIVAVIVNYVKRDDVAGTVYASHFTWQIRTFWYSFLWGLVGWLTVWMIGLGVVVWAVAGIWYIYRIVKGWLFLVEGRAMYS